MSGTWAGAPVSGLYPLALYRPLWPGLPLRGTLEMLVGHEATCTSEVPQVAATCPGAIRPRIGLSRTQGRGLWVLAGERLASLGAHAHLAQTVLPGRLGRGGERTWVPVHLYLGMLLSFSEPSSLLCLPSLCCAGCLGVRKAPAEGPVSSMSQSCEWPLNLTAPQRAHLASIWAPPPSPPAEVS